MRFGSVGIFLFVLCIGVVSAGFFDDVFLTGHVVNGEVDMKLSIEDIECEDAKVVFDDKYLNYEIPGGIPFSDDVFDVYIDDEFFVSFELVDKKISGMSCDVSEDVSYNVYVSLDLIEQVDGVEDYVEFYNEKKKNGELVIDAVGFGKSVKLGFINFGLWVAGWFS